MFMGYSRAIEFLYALQLHGIKLGLDNPRRLLGLLGNPHSSFKSIHVAGTNGKGSTSASIASIIQEMGLKAGLFTSPHLSSFTERIKVNNTEITESVVVALTDEIRKAVERERDFNPTFFEFVTAIGFLYFKNMSADWAVVETGMGGRLDATNVLDPVVSVITPVGLDHKEFLGSTIKEVSMEKAGIIKENTPVVVSAQQPDALDVILKKADEKNSRVFAFGRDYNAIMKSSDLSGVRFDYESKSGLMIKDLFMPLRGAYQAHNGAAAVRAIETAFGMDIEPEVRRGLQKVRWLGRLETVSMNPEILLDGAHNPPAAMALAEELRRLFLGSGRRMILVMGAMADKDKEGIMKPLLPMAWKTIFTRPPFDRAEQPEELQKTAKALGFESETAPTVETAIEKANGLAKGNDAMILVTGSFYTIGEARAMLTSDAGVLRGLRE